MNDRKPPPPIIVDIWGGERSQTHLARFVRGVDTALEMARHELAAGYLVNLRADADFDAGDEFDDRGGRA